MEGDEARRGKEALSGGHLCHVCGYQYPNPNPSAKLRRSHRRNCRKVTPAAGEREEGGGGLGVDEREGDAGERNAGEGLTLGGGGGGGEGGDGASEANGGSALRGSAREDGDSVEDKENAEHASPNGAGIQVNNSDCVEKNLINCTNNSFETSNEDNETNLPRACTNGSQHTVANHCSEIATLAVAHPAEREDSFDEYQDASPFLHQSVPGDGSAVAHEPDIPIEIKNLNSVSFGTGVAANEVSVEMNGLCKDHFSIEPSMTDFPACSKVGKEVECYSEKRTLGLAGPEDSLKLEGTDECSVNIDSNNTDVVEVDSKSDKTSGYCGFTGDSNLSSLQKCSPLMSDTESQSTCSKKVEGFMEDNMDVLHIMSEVSPRSEIIRSGNIGSETISSSGTNFVSPGNELKLIHSKNTSTDCSTECSSQDLSVEDTSDVQNDLAVTNVNDMLKSIAEDNCSVGILVKGSVSGYHEERPQQDVEQIVTIAEENPSLEKHSGFSEEEVCNRENDAEVPTKYQVSTSQEHVTLLMDQASCIKNPFNLDDVRSDDLFELASDSYHLETPNVVESKQQVDSTSLPVSSQTSIAEGLHCLITDDHVLAVSSENGYAIGAEAVSVSSSADHTKIISLHDASVNASAKKMNADNVEEEKLTEDTGTEMIGVTQADDVEETKLAEDTGAKEGSAVRSMENVEEKNQAEDAGAKEVRAVRSMEHIHVKNQTKDASAKDTGFNADNVEDKRQIDDTSEEETNVAQHTDNVKENKLAQETCAKEMIAVQSTDNVEEKKQIESTVGQEGHKQNEEIAAIGSRLNSGRIHVPLKVLLAEASVESKEKKRSTKERVLSFRRRESKDDAPSAKPGSAAAGSDDLYWNSPARLPHSNVDKRSKGGRKQPWMPFSCCHSVH